MVGAAAPGSNQLDLYQEPHHPGKRTTTGIAATPRHRPPTRTRKAEWMSRCATAATGYSSPPAGQFDQ